MPRKAKRSVVARKSVFIAAEGYVETAFLEILREYYSLKEYKVSVTDALKQAHPALS